MSELPPSPHRKAVVAIVVAVVAMFMSVYLLDWLFWTDLVRQQGGYVRVTGDGDVYSVHLTSPDFDDDDVAMAARIPTLERLRLDGSSITDDALIAIRSVENLQQVDLSRTAITDAGVGRLSGLRRLNYLTLRDCPHLTGPGLIQLHDLPNLYQLDVQGIDVSFADLTRLKSQLPQAAIRVDPETVLGIPDPDDLRYARWRNDPYGIQLDCGFPVTGQWLSRLEDPEAVIQLSMRARTPAALRALRSFRRLTVLHVSGCDDVGAAVLADCRELRQLSLAGSLTDSGLEDLFALEQLESLRVASANVQGDAFDELRRLRELRRLSLHCPEVDPAQATAGIAALAELPNLASLDLTVPLGGHGALGPLRDCPELRHLGLRGCGLTDEQLAAPLPGVASLDLRDNPLTPACLETLSQWPALEEVTLDPSIRSGVPPDTVAVRFQIN